VTGVARVKSDPATRRKLIAFDPETWMALDLLAQDRMASVQELADEAFADLLKKHGRPTTLKLALRDSGRSTAAESVSPSKSSARRRRATRARV
jgi:hypothetical protein